MHTVTIIRDHVMFGPYDKVHALEYFKEGKMEAPVSNETLGGCQENRL